MLALFCFPIYIFTLLPREERARKHGGERADEVEENRNLFSLGNVRKAKRNSPTHYFHLCHFRTHSMVMRGSWFLKEISIRPEEKAGTVQLLTEANQLRHHTVVKI